MDVASLLRKYPIGAARYASYPGPEHFRAGVGAADLRKALKRRGARSARRPLALVVNVDDTSANGSSGAEDVAREALLYGELLGPREEATQLHIAAGDAEALRRGTITSLLGALAEYLVTLPPREARSIEIDARAGVRGALEEIAALGFKRVCVTSRGGTPLDDALGAALEAIACARRAGIACVGAELRYGAPAQSAQALAAAIECIVQERPGHVTLSAHRAPPAAPAADHPGRAAELAQCIECLSRAGYEYAGLDVFELPGATAPNGGAPHPLHERTDVLGLGIAAVSAIGDCYSQNADAARDYGDAVRGDSLPVARGHRMTPDDLLRREVIHSLECRFALPFSALEYKYGVEFAPYFAEELARLEDMQSDGLVELYADAIELTSGGRPLARAVSALFDRYLREYPAPRTGADP